MKKTKVSVIVPIYNSERYLRECIDSILNQQYKDIELILVNDGSTDESGRICESYSSNHNVKYIFQTNQGVSVARQNGVNNAEGYWILFVDSDDTLPANAIAQLMSISSNVDIVAGATDRDKRHKTLPDYISALDYVKMLYSENFGPTPTSKLFKISLFSDNTVKQFKQFASGEDLLMNLSLAVANKKDVRVCKDSTYHYRKNDNSVTHKFRKTYEYCSKYFVIKENVVKNMLQRDEAQRLGLRQKIRFFYQIVVGAGFVNDNSDDFVKNLKGDLIKYQPYNFLDRVALTSNNRLFLRMMYYLYRIRTRVSGRVYF